MGRRSLDKIFNDKDHFLIIQQEEERKDWFTLDEIDRMAQATVKKKKKCFTGGES